MIPFGLAAQKLKKQTQEQAQQQAGGEREVKGEVAAPHHKVPREPAKERDSPDQREDDAQAQQNQPHQNQNTADPGHGFLALVLVY
jgi:hypothetical protein